MDSGYGDSIREPTPQKAVDMDSPCGSLEFMGPDERLQILDFVNIRELGRFATLNADCRADVDVPAVWADCYERTQRAAGAATGELKRLIERPFGEAAVGWRVSVCSSVSARFYPCGIIEAYDGNRNAYLVRYFENQQVEGDIGPDRKVWESEVRRDPAAQRNPSLSSRSRFRFLAPPAESETESSTPSGIASTSAMVSDTNATVDARGQFLRFSSWRQELQHCSKLAPIKNLATLRCHRDEVLFVAFSPCGSRLASCSRDGFTIIHRIDGQWPPARETSLRHHTGIPAWATWTPQEPYTDLLVCLEGSPPHMNRDFSMCELWDVVRVQCRRFRVAPRDAYAAIVPWKPPDPPDESPEASSNPETVFVMGHPGSVSFNNRGFEQRLMMFPAAKPERPCGVIQLQNDLNYFHCLTSAPPNSAENSPHGPSTILCLTGVHPHQCSSIALLDLASTRRVGETELNGIDGIPVYTLDPKIHHLENRAVLSGCWAKEGALILVNTRPHVGASEQAPLTGTETLSEVFRRPVPTLGTAIELLALDSTTFDVVGVFGGHHAFTTSEAPFILHVTAWADADFVSSGGEDHCVYVWHRRHQRLIRRLEGHREAVNCVSWCAEHNVLVSASDDHSMIFWGCGSAS